MRINDIKNITASDLRVIILALKMEEFNIDDEKAKNDVCERIKKLPSAENINIIASNGGAIKDLQNEIGYILEMVDKYSARDGDYKFRYKARTGLDPRYKVLEYKRIIANKEMKMKKEAVGLVKELVRVSSNMDKNGYGKLSSDLITIAKAVKDETANEATLTRFNGAVESLRLAGFEAEAESLLKEAGFWSGVADVAKGIGRGVADVGKSIGQGVANVGRGIGEGVQKGVQKAKETFQMGNLRGTFEKVNQELTKALDYATKIYPSITDANKKQKASDIMTMMQNMQTVGSQVYNLVMEDAAAQPAQQPAQQPANVQTDETMDQTSNTFSEPVTQTTTSPLTSGQKVTWESKTGQPQSATVVGPAAVEGQVIIQYPNGRQIAVNESRLRAACEHYRMTRKG